MKRQYLGDSKYAFKWDCHDYLVSELNCPALVFALIAQKFRGGRISTLLNNWVATIKDNYYNIL